MTEMNKKTNRVKVADMPQPERELTAEEQKKVKGGVGASYLIDVAGVKYEDIKLIAGVKYEDISIS